MFLALSVSLKVKRYHTPYGMYIRGRLPRVATQGLNDMGSPLIPNHIAKRRVLQIVPILILSFLITLPVPAPLAPCHYQTYRQDNGKRDTFS